MITFAALVLTILTFAFIIYPFFRQRLQPASSIEDEPRRELQSKRDTTYAMLKELEFDYQSGILTDEDYQDLEERYKKKAISILKSIDETEEDTPVEDEIEKQILELRQSKGKHTKGETEIEKEILELRQSKGRFCHQCGQPVQIDDRFCSHCGTKLRQKEIN